MYTLSLEIINKCNLNCTYCYLGEKKNTYMSLETAQKAIDKTDDSAQTRSRFFGRYRIWYYF